MPTVSWNILLREYCTVSIVVFDVVLSPRTFEVVPIAQFV